MRAVEYLQRGQALQPTNPLFTTEMAHALLRAGDAVRALALYESIHDVGPYVSVWSLAAARRGAGAALLELDRIDEAEQAYRAALEVVPGNPIAQGELRYIDALRRGATFGSLDAVTTQTPSPSTCAICGEDFTSGKLMLVDGLPRGVCERCVKKQGRKWWRPWPGPTTCRRWRGP